MDKKDNIKDLMEEFKDFKPTKGDMERISSLTDAYKDKSEEEIFFEIIRVNEDMEMSMSEEEYEKIFSQLESIRSLLSEEQIEKLDKILYILGK